MLLGKLVAICKLRKNPQTRMSSISNEVCLLVAEMTLRTVSSLAQIAGCSERCGPRATVSV